MVAMWSRMSMVLLFQQLDSGTTMVRVTNGSYVESYGGDAIISTTRLGHHDGSGNEW
jgi:hypothetical protein